MLRQLEQIPYVKDLVKRLRRNPYLRHACSYRDKAPCDIAHELYIDPTTDEDYRTCTTISTWF